MTDSISTTESSYGKVFIFIVIVFFALLAVLLLAGIIWYLKSQNVPNTCTPACTNNNGCNADGKCVCGSNPACTGYNTCVNGSCVVNTCTTACTNNNGCDADGKCVCGSNPACTGYTSCVNGSCKPNTCTPACTNNNGCNADGTCVCGATSACTGYDTCVSGECVTPTCIPACTGYTSCVNGSCVANTCTNPCTNNNGCDAYGTCVCGATSACTGSDTCVDGNCVTPTCTFAWEDGCIIGPHGFQQYIGAWPSNRYGENPVGDWIFPVSKWAENPLNEFLSTNIEECEKACSDDPLGCIGYSYNENDSNNIRCALWPPPGPNSLIAPALGGDSKKMVYGYRSTPLIDQLTTCPASQFDPQPDSIPGSGSTPPVKNNLNGVNSIEDIPPGCWVSLLADNYIMYTGGEFANDTSNVLLGNSNVTECAHNCDITEGCVSWALSGTANNNLGDSYGSLCRLKYSNDQFNDIPRNPSGSMQSIAGVKKI